MSNKYPKYYTVLFHGRIRFSTVYKDEAENYADALFAKCDNKGQKPIVEECDR